MNLSLESRHRACDCNVRRKPQELLSHYMAVTAFIFYMFILCIPKILYIYIFHADLILGTNYWLFMQCVVLFLSVGTRLPTLVSF